MTPFHYACSTGNEVALAQTILQHEPDLQTTDKNGKNPLMSEVIIRYTTNFAHYKFYYSSHTLKILLTIQM